MARAPLLLAAVLFSSFAPAGRVFVRFKLLEPTETSYYVRIGGSGYIHIEPWLLPTTVLPAGADSDGEALIRELQTQDDSDLHENESAYAGTEEESKRGDVREEKYHSKPAAHHVERETFAPQIGDDIASKCNQLGEENQCENARRWQRHWQGALGSERDGRMERDEKEQKFAKRHLAHEGDRHRLK
jgi:hypothetical protein